MRKLTLSLAVLAALLPLNGNTLGLGELELNSALNQELDADIEVLSATPEDAEQLIVKLASRDAFARAGIDRPYLLQQLRFKVVTKGDKSFVKVFTKKPIREPFLSFLLEIDWPEGHLLREYTLLLDPPVYSGGPAQTSTAPQVDTGRPFIDPADSMSTAQPVTSQQDYARPAESSYQAPGTVPGAVAPGDAPVVIESDTGRQVTYQPVRQYAEVSGTYRVQQNDTLWSVASNLRPDSSISVEQMMLALVRENPESFIKENIHGLKRGYILRMPDRNAITSVDRQAALAQVREQTALWREYREALTGAAPASAMEAEPTVTAEGVVEEEGEGKLSIVSASDEEGSEVAAAGQDPKAQELNRLRAELSLAQEALESEKLEKENLQSRLAELEQRVQRVLEMDDSELAQLQQDVLKAEQPVEPVVEEPIAEEVPVEEAPVEEVPVEEMVEEPVVIDEQLAEQPVEVEPTEEALAEQPVEEVITEEGVTPAEESVFMDETAVAEQPAEVEPAAPTMEPAEAPPFVQTKPKSFIENILDNPSMLAAIGGGISALLVGLILVLRRLRKGKSEEDEWTAGEDELTSLEDTGTAESFEEPSALGEADETTEMAAGEFDDTEIEAPAEEQLDDTVISLAAEEPVAPAEEEKDDVIAEADVYLAYGIYQQAEDLLQKAIGANPDRDDYRMKLLETHFAGKNSDAFASLAEEVHPRKGDDRSYWERVVVMGRELCPDHQLFSSESAATLPGLDTEELIPKKPETADLDVGEAEMGADLDLGLDDMGAADETQAFSEPLDLEEPAAEEAPSDELDLAADLEEIASELEEPAEESLEADLSEDESLEFDLGDFGDELAEPTEAAPEEAAAEETSLDIDEDFSLDFEASDLGFESHEEEAEPAAEEPVAEEAAGLELDADLDLGVDLEAEPEEEVALDLDMDTGGDLELGGEEVAGLDLDSDLDLGAEEEVALDLEEAAEEAPLSLGDEDDDFDISELSEDVDEVSTKLDLARAYIDMGDSEGAKSILEEVKQEGNEQQQQQADELLQQAS